MLNKRNFVYITEYIVRFYWKNFNSKVTNQLLNPYLHFRRPPPLKPPRRSAKKPYVRHELPYSERKRRKKPLRPSSQFGSQYSSNYPVDNSANIDKYSPVNHPSRDTNSLESYKDSYGPSPELDTYRPSPEVHPQDRPSNYNSEDLGTLYRWDDTKGAKAGQEEEEAWWTGANDNRWYRGDYQDEFRETHDYYSLDVVKEPGSYNGPPHNSADSYSGLSSEDPYSRRDSPAYYDYNHYDYKQ